MQLDKPVIESDKPLDRSYSSAIHASSHESLDHSRYTESPSKRLQHIFQSHAPHRSISPSLRASHEQISPWHRTRVNTNLSIDSTMSGYSKKSNRIYNPSLSIPYVSQTDLIELKMALQRSRGSSAINRSFA